jgi:hypothetical protein
MDVAQKYTIAKMRDEGMSYSSIAKALDMKKVTLILVSLMLVMLALVTLAEGTAAYIEAPAIDLTPIFQAVLGILAALITHKQIPWIQARTTAQQQEMLRAAVSVLVYAAEQLYGAGAGKEKLMYIKGQLAKKGYKIDIDEIEAAVRELTVIGE